MIQLIAARQCLSMKPLIITINISNVIASGGGSFPTSRISNEDYANMNWI